MCQDCIDAAKLTWDTADILDRLADCKKIPKWQQDDYRHKAEALRDLGSQLDEDAGACDPERLRVR